MRIALRLLIATITATGLLAFAVGGSASARRFRVEDEYTATGNFGINFGGVISVECKLTLEGTFHSAVSGSATFSKVCGALVGVISRAETGTCVEGGSARVLTETLPWHIRYSGFSGTLPSVTEIQYQIVGMAIRIMMMASACLIRTTTARPLLMSWKISYPRVAELRFLGSRITTEAGCDFPGEGAVGGTFRQEDHGSFETFIQLVT